MVKTESLFSQYNVHQMYASSLNYTADGNQYLTELILVDELIFHCYSDNGAMWCISTTCKLYGRIAWTSNGVFTNVYELTGSVDINKNANMYSRNKAIVSLRLMAILCRFSNSYSGERRQNYFQWHHLDSRWDGVADRIRAELW
jgi:hypothetical protein